MDSFDDRELKELLRAWTAPDTPSSLTSSVSAWRTAAVNPVPEASRVSRTLRWLVTGTIRVPVPIGALAAVVLGLWLFSRAAQEPAAMPAAAPVTLDDFRPVARLEPRIVGEP